MKIPKGMTEKEVIAVINKITRHLKYIYKFGYHEYKDMEQQAWVFALEGLEAHDNKRPLENFLWIHIKNRLYNFKRNNYERPNKPCLKCPISAYLSFDDSCQAFDDKMECNLYNGWITRNNKKRNLMNVVENDDTIATKHKGPDSSTEIIELIDDELPVEFRADWIKLKFEIKIPKHRKQRLREEIEKIMEENHVTKEG